MGRALKLSAVEQVRIWELRAGGRSLSAIARAIGQPRQTVGRYVALTGGRRPVLRRRAAGCLSVGEREEISRGLARGESCRQIAASITRSHTTISREVRHNGGPDGYRAEHADRSAWKRARRPKPAKLAINAMLRAIVEDKLERKWSPEQIALWLQAHLP